MQEYWKNLSLEDLPNEEWRDVVGYEGLYQVSNKGRVKSLKSYGKVETHLLKQSISNKGYLRVTFSKNGKAKRVSVSRLVAVHFIPNPQSYLIVNHKNENPLINVVENLEWCTHKYNTNYGTCRKRIGQTHRDRETYYNKPVLQFALNGTLIKEWSNFYELSDAGFDRHYIMEMCKEKKGFKSVYNSIWKFK